MCASGGGICSGDASARYARFAPVFDFIQIEFLGYFAARVRRFVLCGLRRRASPATLMHHEHESAPPLRCCLSLPLRGVQQSRRPRRRRLTTTTAAAPAAGAPSATTRRCRSSPSAPTPSAPVTGEDFTVNDSTVQVTYTRQALRLLLRRLPADVRQEPRQVRQELTLRRLGASRDARRGTALGLAPAAPRCAAGGAGRRASRR